MFLPPAGLIVGCVPSSTAEGYHGKVSPGWSWPWEELALYYSVSSVAHIGPPPKVIVVELALGGVGPVLFSK
jgi:hypothetical protein